MNRTRIADILFLAGLLLLAASMPLSVFGMSLSQFFLAGGWLLAPGLAARLRHLRADLLAPALAGVYLWHVAGTAYSADIGYALKDLRIKLPLLLMPLFLATAPPATRRHAPWVLLVLALAVTASTLVSTGVLVGLVPHARPLEDVREISLFISHIRLALLVCFTVWILAALAAQTTHRPARIGYGIWIAWLLCFLYLLESMTGMLVLLATAMAAAVRFLWTRRRGRVPVLAALVLVPLALVAYVRHEAATVYGPAPAYDTLATETAGGRPYRHFRDRPEQENGHLVWIYVCEPELAAAWNRRSTLPFDGRDRANHELKYTLVRYLASKGLRKDSAAVHALGDDDIAAIESGIANTDYRNPGSLRQRIRKTIKEYYLYRDGANPTGSSVMQRLEYWKAGWNIFKRHWPAGVGTGDVPAAFEAEYAHNGTRLDRSEWHRAHNQYLTFAIAFGIPGLLYFLFTLAFAAARRRAGPGGLFLAFSVIAVLSMLTEDTLETQAGVTFFAFLNGFLLFFYRPDSPSPPAK